MDENTLNSALRHFETTESNLHKLEKIYSEIEAAYPSGIIINFTDPNYDDNRRHFHEIWKALPHLNSWKPEITLSELHDLAQQRLDIMELDEPACTMEFELQLQQPGKLLQEYRYRFDQTRRELIRDSIITLIDDVDNDLRIISKNLSNESETNESIIDPQFDNLKNHVAQIDTLLGSSVPRPQRWNDLHRHMYFGMINDINDIIKLDWPSVKAGLRKTLYGEKEAIPVEIEDLSSLVKNKPHGPVTTKLNWEQLNEEQFERLIFTLISSEKEYENPAWLTKTNASDHGRDLSVDKVHVDSLSGTTRQRAIIQCKHWLTKSIGPTEIALLREQMKLWEPPRVDICIIATSGRFTTDAISLIEKHNQSDSGLRIIMWPESHLERLLASRPHIIAEFNLR